MASSRRGSQASRGRASAAWLRLLDSVGALDDGVIYVLDLQRWKVLLATDRIVDVLGLQRETVEGISIDPMSDNGRQIRELIHPDDLELFLWHLQELRGAPDDAVVKFHCRLRHADQTWRWVEARSRAFERDSKGELRTAVGVAMRLPLNASAGPQTDAAALLQAEESERRRIARELHDSAAQYLVAIDLQLSALDRELKTGSPKTLKAKIAEIRDLTYTLQRELRVSGFAMHAPELDHVELVEVLRVVAAGFQRRTGLPTAFEVRGKPVLLWRAAEHALLRVAQEGLMNIHKHAGATSAKLSLKFAAQSVMMEIEDDGVGADAETRKYKIGTGLDNMRERMSAIGGVLSIVHRQPGFLVRAWVGQAEAARAEQNGQLAEAPKPAKPKAPRAKSKRAKPKALAPPPVSRQRRRTKPRPV